jgi:hypothetical protein
MSLNWNVENVAGFEELCFEHREDGEEGPGRYLRKVTNRLIWLTMAVDIGKITEKNWAEFYARVKLVNRLDGYSDEEYITPEVVKAHIGLSTNVCNETRLRFIKKSASYTMNDLVRKAEKAVAEKAAA